MKKIVMMLIISTFSIHALRGDDYNWRQGEETGGFDEPARKEWERDPGRDFNIWISTADIQDQGKLVVNCYAIVGIGITYGVLDDLQISFTAGILGPAITPAIKWRLFHSDHFDLSVKGGYSFQVKDEPRIYDAGHLFLLVDLKIDQYNRLSFGAGVFSHLGGGRTLLYNQTDFEGDRWYSYSAGFISRLNSNFKLSFEVITGIFEQYEETTVFSGALGYLYSGGSINISLSLFYNQEIGLFPIPLPFLTVSHNL